MKAAAEKQQEDGQVRRSNRSEYGEKVRFRRDRFAVTGLVGLIVVCLLAYVATAAGTARELRKRNALERNENTARLCARLLDEQCDSALSVLKALAQQPLLAARLGGNKNANFTGHLKDAVELVPDLLAVAICDPHGTIQASYPRAIPFPASLGQERWFRRAAQRESPVIGEVLRLGDAARSEVLPIVLPVLKGAEKTGYIVAYYRLGDIYDWLRGVHVSGGVVYIVNARGHIVAANGTIGNLPLEANSPLTPVLLRARHGDYGSQLLATSASAGGLSVVGYAHAARPDWSLLVLQPAAAAFGPTDFLLQRLLLVTVPLLVFVPLAAWVLLTLYHRQLRLTRLLSERNEQLRKADQAKSDLLANVSHDLKTPIASMRLSLSGIRDSSADAVQIEDCLSVMGEELEQLATRVRNLLDMARLEAEGEKGIASEPRCLEPCDLADVAGAALERLRLRLRDRPLLAQFPPTPLLVECDQAQMETVLVNLLENALNYSPDGSPICLSGAVEANQAVLRVSDAGPGIPLENRERIFEKFYRVANGGATGGTGLGLAICRSVVEAHGGIIRVGDGAAGGAEFGVVLPLIQETTVDLEPAEPTEANRAPSARSDNRDEEVASC